MFGINPGELFRYLFFIPGERKRVMISVKTPDGTTVTIKPIKPTKVVPTKVVSARLTIRSDEAARRTVADTDGTVRRARQLAESNRLI
jgi:phage protein D